MAIIVLYLRKIMFGFKLFMNPLSEDENLMKLRQTADDLHETADKLRESVDKLMSKKNGKNRKRT